MTPERLAELCANQRGWLATLSDPAWLEQFEEIVGAMSDEITGLRAILTRIADAKDSLEWWADLDRLLNRLPPGGA